jgi:hypothetical protein
VDRDEYFLNELSSEYKFFLNHLIKRCEYNLLNDLVLNNNLIRQKISDKSDIIDSQINKNRKGDAAKLTIEEQKNLALFYLSTKHFNDFEQSNFDLEILAELLNDLLYSLPQSLIPIRYIDYCFYSEFNYEKVSFVFIYMARSHVMMFEMIVKFLQIYLKCLSTSSSAYNEILANAIFQICKSDIIATSKGNSSNNLINNNNCQTQAANTFLKLFIDNHTKYLTI